MRDLKDEIERFAETAERAESASKLDPYADLITVLLTKQCTFQKISEILQNNLNLKASPSTIHSFVNIRRKRALREFTYNALKALHHLYSLATGNVPSYDRLIADLLNPSSIPNLYQDLFHQVQQTIADGNMSYIDRRKYEASFEIITSHWLNLPAEIQKEVIETIQHNSPNAMKYFLQNHVVCPEKANPEFFYVR